MNSSTWLNNYGSLVRSIQQSKILYQKLVSSSSDEKEIREARLSLRKKVSDLEKVYKRLNKQLNTIKKNPTKYSLTQREYMRRRDNLSEKKIEIDKLKNWKSARSKNKIKFYQQSKEQLERERMEFENKYSGLDNSQILDINRTTMKNQDKSLDELSNCISRITNIALEIGNELDLHNKLLDDIDTKMDKVDHKLKRSTRKMRKFF
ncbi:syntaxin-51-related [Anaeramoeba flamelloides]|uniref:Syntaxin-51-related n=1 Tax=Anaeramoeba flamelloides TaxID=1746091 RepID=A0ABQ8XEE2_9EUKA|nr:syntaxin-51-related [Anaeramoeba flamelloides]